MIARMVRRQAKVAGEPPAGVPYSAGDAQLLGGVQATAAFGFAEAYSRYVDPLSDEEFDTLYGEGAPVSQLYGALGTPQSDAQRRALFDSMRGRLEPSAVIFQFLEIMRETPAFPRPLLWMQRMLVRAAVDIIPDWIRECLGLTEYYGLRPRERWMVRLADGLAGRRVSGASPRRHA